MALLDPEPLEIFLEKIGPDRLEVDGKQFLELGSLFLSPVLGSFEQAPTAAG